MCRHVVQTLLLGIATVLLLPVSAWTADYFVKGNGNDNLDGKSIANAWATVARVRAMAWSPGLKAGDRILFEGGASFAINGKTEELYIQGDLLAGTSKDPVTIESYGEGKATILAKGAHFFQYWAPSNSTSGLGIVIRNLIIQGDGNSRTGSNADGLQFWNSSASTLDYLLLEGLEITGFAGNGIETGSGLGMGRYTSVTVRNCVVHDNPGAPGVSPHSGSGIILAGCDGALVERCIAYGNGINNNNPGGPVGIWFWDCTNSTIQNCESHHNQTTHGDGGGFDLDGGCQNCLIQYCFSHDNAGAGYLFAQFAGASAYGPLQHNTVRYCISQNDGRKGGFAGFYFWGAGGADVVGPNHVYNNTVYMGTTPENGSPSCVGFLGSSFMRVKLRNNIFIAGNGRTLVDAGAFDTSQVLFQGNDYWVMPGTDFIIRWGADYASLDAWLTANAGQEWLNGKHIGLTLDPMLENPGSAVSLNNTDHWGLLTEYQLQPGSLMVDAAIDLNDAFGVNPGACDFYGTAIPVKTGFDIGAHEAPDLSAVERAQPSGADWRLTPNPVRDRLQILDGGQRLRGAIFDVSGKKRLGFTSSGGTCGIDVTQLPRGVYVLRMEGDASRRPAVLFVKE